MSMGLRAWDRVVSLNVPSSPPGICVGGLPLTMLLPLRTALPDEGPGTVPPSPVPALDSASTFDMCERLSMPASVPSSDTWGQSQLGCL